MSSGSRKRLLRQLDAALAEIERLKGRYQRGIEQLERSLRQNLPPSGCAQWFTLYLRVVDLGVEIRRGELRHRSSRQVQFSCMHTTGIKGAKHSGLSIDDANTIFQLLEERGAVSARRLAQYYMQMDTLDRDDIQLLDERLTVCLEHFLALQSAFYSKLEFTGLDPHQSLSVYGGAAQREQVVARVDRVCLTPSACKCEEDAEPWETFVIHTDAETSIVSRLDSAKGQKTTARDAGGERFAGGRDGAEADVGMLDIKRQFGYDEPERSRDDHQALEQDARDLKRLKLFGAGGAGIESKPRVPHRPPPRQVYKSQCEKRGIKPKPTVLELLGVRNGAMQLNLSRIGFQSADDLHDIAEVVASVTEHVAVDELNASSSFFNRNAFGAFCKLVQLPSVSKNVKKVTLRGLSLPRREDFAALLRLFQSRGEIRELDISFNTLSRASAECLESLFRANPRLERLVLVSCFPDQSCLNSIELIEAMRAALLSCSSGANLHSVRLDSNWVHRSWLSALLSRDSCVQELRVSDIKLASLPAAEDVEMTGDQQTTWELHFDHLTSLTVSEATDLGSSFSSSIQTGTGISMLVDGLRRGFQVDFMQLKHLELAIPFTVDDQTGRSRFSKDVIDLIEQVRDYGGLSSLALSLEHSPAGDVKLEPLKQLVAGGLGECEALRLSIGHVRSLRDLQELIADCALPKARTVEFSAQVVADDVFTATSGEDAQRLGRSVCASLCNPEQHGSLSAFTLRVEALLQPEDWSQVTGSERTLGSFFEEIKRAWQLSDPAASSKAATSRVCSTSKQTAAALAAGPEADTLDHFERVTYSCCLGIK